MAFDFKKEYKDFYHPGSKPEIIEIPKMNFIAVRGKGDPNEEDGEYKKAVGLLYGIAYTIKMSYKGNYKIDGFFEYVVPPLEGFWWMDDIKGVDYSRKRDFRWISVIRLPEFVKPSDVDWAISEAGRKKQADFSSVEFFTYNEGLCVQCLHIGAYDDEPSTVAEMDAYAVVNGYAIDITSSRHHHEIYLNDPRKIASDKSKTVIRHPIKKA